MPACRIILGGCERDRGRRTLREMEPEFIEWYGKPETASLDIGLLKRPVIEENFRSISCWNTRQRLKFQSREVPIRNPLDKRPVPDVLDVDPNIALLRYYTS